MGPAVRKAIGFPQRQGLSREELFEFHIVICLSSDKQGSSVVNLNRSNKFKVTESVVGSSGVILVNYERNGSVQTWTITE